ncbi:phosphoglycerate mutase [Streptococcus bovimastitidis]|uniref:Phosphoglycerate mutase n=2 Tax=Streptococcus bovimastitidis TaxID=1856638 RepID=A0A1L8MP65_9STRE|nr:phosphoglycerate mutase [Streptococcus bovimastitidis]
MKLYLMRHGETLFNTQGRVQGACDSPLTEKGIEQAKTVKDYFEKEHIKFDYAYSSTQERATDTARLVSNLPIVQLKGLKEWNFGIFEAQPEMLLPKSNPEADSFEDLLVPYGGESVDQVSKRVKKTIQDELKDLDCQNVLMVTHGGAMWALGLELNIPFPHRFHLGNCAIFEFELNHGELTFLNLIEPYKNFETFSFSKGVES